MRPVKCVNWWLRLGGAPRFSGVVDTGQSIRRGGRSESALFGAALGAIARCDRKDSAISRCTRTFRGLLDERMDYIVEA